MKHLLLIILLLAGLAAQAQSAARPDTLLARQAFGLVQHFDRAGWQGLAAALRPKPRPIWSYIVRGQVASQSPVLRLPAYYPLPGDSYVTRVSAHGIRRFNNHMYALGLARRQSDYERLRDELLVRATKVRKLQEALPVLLFAVDSAGRVQDVTVDKTRSSYGLTQRSRKIILQALRQSRFRALEARYSFSRPRPFRERLRRLALGQRLSVASHALSGLVPHKRMLDGELRYTKKRRLGSRKIKPVPVP